MDAKHFKWSAGMVIVGILIGILLTRYSGKNFVGQPSPPPPAPAKTSDGPEYNHRNPISTADLSKLFPQIIVRQGNPKLKTLALTFDDGPDTQYTPQILDILKKYKIKATFFVVGTQIQKYPAMFRRIIREGHDIGSHSFQHLKFSEMTAAQINYQLRKNFDIIRAAGGPAHLKLFRPPYGALDAQSIRDISAQHYKIILWTIDSLDWRGLGKPQVEKNILPLIHDGYISLQHCASQSKKEDLSGSVAALPGIITAAQKEGYRFVTISTLLKEAGRG